jgi:hypothetical protein
MKKDMPSHYYNTTHLKGSELSEAVNAAKTQDAKVLLFFRLNPEAKLSKYQVYDSLISQGFIDSKTPNSSIGRSINSLTKFGSLVKTNEHIIERCGRKNYLWRLNH